MILIILLSIGAYLIGSIPMGYIIAVLKGINIQKYGSGNIGATNVARILGKPYFFLILLLDAGKVYTYLTLCAWFGLTYAQLLAIGALLLLGNGSSIFLHFRGGKGIAHLVGLLAFINVYLLGLFIVSWLLLAYLLKNIGIASILATLIIPIGAYFLLGTFSVFYFLGIAGWCWYLHRSNVINYLYN